MTLQKLTVSVCARHSASCGRKDDAYWRGCRCPKWLYINDRGKRTQRSDENPQLGSRGRDPLLPGTGTGLMAPQKQAGNDQSWLPATLSKLEATEGPGTLATAVASLICRAAQT
jgi:hypothetical protein